MILPAPFCLAALSVPYGTFVLALVIHAAFVAYVLAGSAYLATATVMGPPPATVGRGEGPIASRLRYSLPFALCGAVATGVAPLMFARALNAPWAIYPDVASTDWRLPIALAVAFGLTALCVLRSKRAEAWPLPARAALGLAAAATLAFAACAWTEGRVFGLEPAVLSRHVSGPIARHGGNTLPWRMFLFASAVPTMTLFVGWQIWFSQRSRPAEERAGGIRTSFLALGGLLASAVAGLTYFFAMHGEFRGEAMGLAWRPYLWLAAIGWSVQAGSWTWQRGRTEFSASALAAASAGWLLSATGVAVVRELRRVMAIGLDSLVHAHAVGEIETWPAMATFAAANASLAIAWLAFARRRRP